MIFVRRIPPLTALILAVYGAFAVAGDEEKIAPNPLRRAHAHNDYLHTRPLFDALDHGFRSVEADIWLVDGKLLVAHDLKDVKPDRTLQSLYLDPLRERMRKHKRVYGDANTFGLLIDIKSEGEQTYRELAKVLTQYSDITHLFLDPRSVSFPLYITVSGNRPIAMIIADKQRRVGIDGRLPDLNSEKLDSSFTTISDNWKNHFRWGGKGIFPESERQKLRSIVEKCHSKNKEIRFWNTPETRACWQELFDADVDLINTDDLDGLRTFLLEKE